MLRLDLLHPVISGNKWYKLRYNVDAALENGKTALLTFGGGYSNHLIAAAYAARLAGLRSIGVIRGHYGEDQITATLRACIAYGMELISFTKAEYAVSATTEGSLRIQEQFPEAYIIPEGGANDAGIRGTGEIAALIPEGTTDVFLAVGTGTTMAGLQMGLGARAQVHGFCAARSCEGAEQLIAGISTGRIPIIRPVSDPRFGKWTQDQIAFMRRFYEATGIPLDVVYTGKMMMDLQTMLSERSFKPDARIVCIHTGGLQGNPAGLFAD
jgi:1-aminocyclopropane-1-carboxylate deaminase